MPPPSTIHPGRYERTDGHSRRYSRSSTFRPEPLRLALTIAVTPRIARFLGYAEKKPTAKEEEEEEAEKSS